LSGVRVRIHGQFDAAAIGIPQPPPSHVTDPSNIDPFLLPAYTDDAQVQRFADALKDPRNDPQSIHYQRPSERWLRQPASIDGAINPPRFYYCDEDMDAALVAAGHPALSRKGQDQRYSVITPTPTPAAQVDRPMSLVPDTPASDVVDTSALSSNHYASVTAEATHLVSVTMFFTPAQTTTTRVKNIKKDKKTKMVDIKMENISRTEFIKQFLS
ncbi:hypothetical protein H0H93_013800, partial [Arthromyces matolae]